MMNDVKALCEVDDPGLVRFVGAYHAPENGQARPAQQPLPTQLPKIPFAFTMPCMALLAPQKSCLPCAGCAAACDLRSGHCHSAASVCHLLSMCIPCAWQCVPRMEVALHDFLKQQGADPFITRIPSSAFWSNVVASSLQRGGSPAAVHSGLP